ncbi:Uncharacterised protein [Serratia odorifera]|uniref:Uncharacterized protein n=1 Tax=Serratia odorifera TaxID=618 RepID=A0A3S4HW98_SEROD|nr:Uncharacterised protein [Serratia odorifera]
MHGLSVGQDMGCHITTTGSAKLIHFSIFSMNGDFMHS